MTKRELFLLSLIPPKDSAKLLSLVSEKTISRGQARVVLREMIKDRLNACTNVLQEYGVIK